MTFQSVSGPVSGGVFFGIFAAGEITPGTVDRFRAYVRDHGIKDARVNFDSLGGSTAEALEFGKAIRELGFQTEVSASLTKPEPATCAAACVYAFAGGTKRFFRGDAHRLGITNTRNTGAVGSEGPTSAALNAFLTERGVDVAAYAQAAGAGSRIIWLNHDAAEMIGIADNGSEPPTTKIDMVNGRPLLAVRQQNWDSLAIADFYCLSDGGIYTMLRVVGDATYTAKYVSGFTSAYVQFDRNDLALVGTGAQAGRTDEYTAIVSRYVPPETAARILTARDMIIWLRHGDEFVWGSNITLHFVRPQIAAYFKACPPRAASALVELPSFEGVASGGGKDLVLAAHSWSAGDRSLILFDRASIVRSGTGVSVVSYVGGRIDGADYFSIEADHFDCIANTGQSSFVEVDRSGKPVSRAKEAWTESDKAVALIGKPACDSSLIPQQMVIGDRDPIALLAQFADSTSDQYP
jgi:hypothetical protein